MVHIVKEPVEERSLRLQSLQRQMALKLVSVVIPVFNSEGFIIDTLHSILKQNHLNIEVIVVNDGSTDGTEAEVLSLEDPRIKYVYQANQGVSAARNRGLDMSSGDYVIFFDSDDLMEPAFLTSRLSVLEEFDFLDFSCGLIMKIDENGMVISGQYKSACIDVKSEILYFREDVVTCPSSYLFRTGKLRTGGIRFNEALASSADRFFLLEISDVLNGSLVRDDASCLLYRYRKDSMSNSLTRKLIKDNIHFYELVLSRNKILGKPRRLFRAKSSYILSGAYYITGNYFMSAFNAVQSFCLDPGNFVKTFYRRKNQF